MNAATSKLDLITKAVHETLPDREWDTWVEVLSPVEIGVFKIKTGLAFFNSARTRILLSPSARQAIVDEIWGIITSGQGEAYLANYGFAIVDTATANESAPISTTDFNGRDCCRWARLRKKCAIGACLCWTTYGGWDCITPDRHGGSHGSCDNAPVCTCKCGHYTDTHIINTVAVGRDCGKASAAAS